MSRRGEERETSDKRGTAERTRVAFERVAALIPGDKLLYPPATQAQLDAAEEHLSQRLPEDVHALYRLHDGQVQYEPTDPRWAAGLFGGLPFLPLDQVLFHWDQWDGFENELDMDDEASSEPEGFVQAKYSLRAWVPLTHDGGGNHIGIDLDPDERGTIGQVILFGRDDDWHRVLAPSLVSYLEQLGDLIEQGHGQNGEVGENGGDEMGWRLLTPNGMVPHTLFRPEG